MQVPSLLSKEFAIELLHESLLLLEYDIISEDIIDIIELCLSQSQDFLKKVDLIFKSNNSARNKDIIVNLARKNAFKIQKNLSVLISSVLRQDKIDLKFLSVLLQEMQDDGIVEKVEVFILENITEMAKSDCILEILKVFLEKNVKSKIVAHIIGEIQIKNLKIDIQEILMKRLGKIGYVKENEKGNGKKDLMKKLKDNNINIMQERLMVIKLFPEIIKDVEFIQVQERVLLIVFSPFLERFMKLHKEDVQESLRKISQEDIDLVKLQNVDNETKYEAIHVILSTFNDHLLDSPKFRKWTSHLILDILDSRIYSALDVLEKYTHLLTKERMWLFEKLRYICEI